jgi:hypothetical protein
MILGRNIQAGKFYRYDHDKNYFILALSLKEITDDWPVVTWLSMYGKISQNHINRNVEYSLELLC